MTLPPLALSVRQPWAWAIVHGGKDVENRSWQGAKHLTSEPKHICIHASKGMTRDEYYSASRFMEGLGVTCPAANELIYGGIIGVTTVARIIEESESPWFFGPRGLVLEDTQSVTPFAVPGALGYFEWEAKGDLEKPKPWMQPKTCIASTPTFHDNRIRDLFEGAK